ncbi:MAG: thermonuclease family protein [Bacteroidales bacterium]
MKQTALLLFTLTLALTASAQRYSGTIISVLDGDTFVFQTEEGSLRIRSEGIDAPEMGQLYGDSAKRFMESYINRKVTVVANGVDRYGRTIGTLFVEGTDVNLEILKAGLAWFYDSYSTNQDYKAAEEVARNRGIALWSDPAPVAPWSWRHGVEPYTRQELTHGQVVICTSEGSYSYHRFLCPGLKRCKVEMKVVTTQEAKAMGRKQCGWCW